NVKRPWSRSIVALRGAGVCPSSWVPARRRLLRNPLVRAHAPAREGNLVIPHRRRNASTTLPVRPLRPKTLVRHPVGAFGPTRGYRRSLRRDGTREEGLMPRPAKRRGALTLSSLGSARSRRIRTAAR